MNATTTNVQQMHPTSNDLSENVRGTSIELLQPALADALNLHSHFKQAHWNTKGPNFISLHELYDEIAEEILNFSDDVAERIMALGGQAQGTLKHATSQTRLPDYSVEIVKEREHLDSLIGSLSHFAKHVRAGIHQADEAGDMDTSDLFTEISRTVDKRLWFLEAHLGG